jgi:hypothetical protein
MQVTSIPQSFVTFLPIEPADYTAPHTFWLRMKPSRLPGLSREHTIAIEQAFRGRRVFKLTGLRLSPLLEN